MRVSLNLMETTSRKQGQEASKSTKVVKISFKIHMKLIKSKFPLKYFLLDDRIVRFWGPTAAEQSSCVLCSASRQSHPCTGSAHRCLALMCTQGTCHLPRPKVARHSRHLAAKLLHPLSHFRDQHSQRTDRDRTASVGEFPLRANIWSLFLQLITLSLGRDAADARQDRA